MVITASAYFCNSVFLAVGSFCWLSHFHTKTTLSYSKGMPLYYCISSACLILFLLLLFTSTPFPYLFMTFSIRNYPGTSRHFYDTKEYLHSTGTLQKELQDCIISSLILFLSHRRNGCCHNNHDFFDILLLLIRRRRFACASSTSVIL